MQLKLSYTLLFGLILFFIFPSSQLETATKTYKLLSSKKEYIAGSKIALEFSGSSSHNPQLYCSYSYGSTVIKPILDGNLLKYELPSFISIKTGLVNWTLLTSNHNSLTGNLKILPQSAINTLESYLGPPQIAAGGKDYTMLVVIPTDEFDNPIADSTLVDIKHQYQDSEITDPVSTKNFIVYKNIYSNNEAGRILIASACLGKNSKEYDVTVSAGLPTDFTISSNRYHSYADGNQIVTFSTSVIKDIYNNIVSDGTYVEFYIKTNTGGILKTSGSSIQGIVTAQILHPDHEQSWSIKAYVNGIAESNTLILNFKPVITDFKVNFSKNNKVIQVGPFQSFMKQMIPDGLRVTLSVYSNDKCIQTLHKTSKNGYVTFKLNPDIVPNANYDFRIQAAGKEKSIKNKELW